MTLWDSLLSALAPVVSHACCVGLATVVTVGVGEMPPGRSRAAGAAEAVGPCPGLPGPRAGRHLQPRAGQARALLLRLRRQAAAAEQRPQRPQRPPEAAGPLAEGSRLLPGGLRSRLGS